MAKYGHGVKLHKGDLKLKEAFCKSPVHQYDLLLFEWEGQYYVDLFLPFNSTTSPFLFNLFTERLH